MGEGRTSPRGFDPVRLAARAVLALMVLAWCRIAPPARALDLDGNNALITETVASRERLRTYDDARQYGAEAVRQRDRRHVKPEGIRAGGFLVMPGADVSTSYDDNIFSAPDSNRVGDLRTEVAPFVDIKSQFPRHALNFSFGGRLVDFLDNKDQNYANYSAVAETALHFDHAHTLAVRLSSDLGHEERGAQTAPLSAAEPVPVFLHEAAIGITRDVGRLYGTAAASFLRRDYQDIDALDGSRLDQDQRDTDEFSTHLRVGYRFSPGFEAIGKFRYIRQDSASTYNPQIDSNGYEALAGLQFETGPLFRWRILAGYGIRDYDDPTVDSFSSSLFEGHLEWLARPDTTLSAFALRRIETVDADDFGGRVVTRGGVRIDHELRNDLVLHLSAAVQNANFMNEEREDWSYTGHVGLEYFLNKNWSFMINYDHETRESTVDAFDMSRNRFGVRAKLRF